MNFHYYHVRTNRAGAHEPRPRGHVEVREDGKQHLYRLSASYPGTVGEFRRWAERVFLTNDGTEKLEGRWPCYRVVMQ